MFDRLKSMLPDVKNLFASGSAFQPRDDSFEAIFECLTRNSINLKSRIDRFLSEFRHPDLSGVLVQGQLIKARLDRVLDSFQAQMDKFDLQRHERGAHYRNWQLEHGIRRMALRSNWMNTALKIMICVLVEGLMAAGLLLGSGHLGVIMAILYGLTLAFIASLLGLLTGYFGLRFATFKIRAPRTAPEDSNIRTAGRVALVAGILGLFLMILTASRVRATGSHSGIFSFNEVGLFEGLNDAFAISLLMLGIVSAVIAMREGYSGIEDPIPGLSRMRAYADDELNADVDGFVAETEDLLAELVGPFLEAADELLAQCADIDDRRADAHLALNAAIRDHNGEIDFAGQRLIAADRMERERRELVTGRPDRQERDLGLDALSQFRIGLISEEDIAHHDLTLLDAGRLHLLRTQIETTYIALVSDIRNAHAEYRAGQIGLPPVFHPDFTNPNHGDDDAL